MKKAFGAILGAMLILGGILFGLYHMENYDKYYYTKIDNSAVSELPASDDMNYEYVLDSYDDKGRKKSLKFQTSKELRQDAYLMLEVRMAGVHKWEEVQFKELPSEVQEILK